MALRRMAGLSSRLTWFRAVVAFTWAFTMSWPLVAYAEQPAPGEAWKLSPFHRAINAASGQPIPCLCRFKERDYRLGEAVCMQTHVGVVIAKCDLLLNNTTWAPTDQPCTLSARPVSLPPA